DLELPRFSEPPDSYLKVTNHGAVTDVKVLLEKPGYAEEFPLRWGSGLFSDSPVEQRLLTGESGYLRLIPVMKPEEHAEQFSLSLLCSARPPLRHIISVRRTVFGMLDFKLAENAWPERSAEWEDEANGLLTYLLERSEQLEAQNPGDVEGLTV